MLYLVGVLLFVLAIAVSIGLHELGHLVAAKSFRVRCPQYFVGFGPTLWSRRVGETEYGVKAIPLGGYVSMIGGYAPRPDGYVPKPARTGPGRWAQSLVEDTRAADAEQLLPTDTNRVIYKLPWWKQAIIYLAGPVVNLVIATVIVGGILVLHGTPEATTEVSTVALCLKTEASANAMECARTDPKSPAAEAGLQPGDVVKAVDGATISSWDALADVIRAHPGQTQHWTVARGSQELQLTVTPKVAERYTYDDHGNTVTGPDGKPKVTRVGYVGVAPATRWVKSSPSAVPGLIGQQLWATTKVILQLPQKVWGIADSTVHGTPRDPNGPMSIVGTGRISGEILQGGDDGGAALAKRLLVFLGLMAGLNMALFVFNLIPLLPLDGGHVAVALWQGLRRGVARLTGRRDPGYVDKARLMPLTLMVFGLFIALTLFLVVADIVNPIRVTG